jgi:hypothetical protein
MTTELHEVAKAAKNLNVSESFLNKARLTGDGPCYIKLKKAVRYPWPDYLEWALAKTRRSTSDRGVA